MRKVPFEAGERGMWVECVKHHPLTKGLLQARLVCGNQWRYFDIPGYTF